MRSIVCFVLLLFSFFGYSQKQLDVFFDFNIDFPNKNSILTLNEWIVSNKNTEIVKLLGYCDSVDTRNYNKILAERRIANVRELLEKSGLKLSDNLEQIAYGKDFKQSKIQSENRKVSIFYTEPQKHITPETSGFPEQIKKAKVGETLKLPNIYFFNNSARILSKSTTSLNELLCVMEENPNLKIEIQGHICCQKVFDLNGVSVARARAVYLYLVRNKIDKKRMTYKGYGTSRPIHPIPEKNSLEEEENRRVEILILEN
ncbi:MAG: OmpA family protein [Flavobacterium sp.]